MIGTFNSRLSGAENVLTGFFNISTPVHRTSLKKLVVWHLGAPGLFTLVIWLIRPLVTGFISKFWVGLLVIWHSQYKTTGRIQNNVYRDRDFLILIASIMQVYETHSRTKVTLPRQLRLCLTRIRRRCTAHGCRRTSRRSTPPDRHILNCPQRQRQHDVNKRSRKQTKFTVTILSCSYNLHRGTEWWRTDDWCALYRSKDTE